MFAFGLPRFTQSNRYNNTNYRDFDKLDDVDACLHSYLTRRYIDGRRFGVHCTYSRRANDHANPIGERHIIIVLQTPRNGAIANTLLALIQLLQ